MISVSFFVWNKESMFPIDKSWEKQKIYLWETWQKHIMCFSNFPFRNTLCVSMGKPFKNHKTCLEMGFSGGNTTQCQQCLWTRISDSLLLSHQRQQKNSLRWETYLTMRLSALSCMRHWERAQISVLLFNQFLYSTTNLGLLIGKWSNRFFNTSRAHRITG